ncbi:MAG TPA: hypothetical protein VMS17_25240 [Gemmataceae bacterium]|nr:hypothetical protein [Gemmataceae bacterium]
MNETVEKLSRSGCALDSSGCLRTRLADTRRSSRKCATADDDGATNARQVFHSGPRGAGCSPMQRSGVPQAVVNKNPADLNTAAGDGKGLI